MIVVRATIRGEPDVPAFTKFFEYGTSDEEIFFSSAAMIEEKLRCKMKLNANEALVLYCAYLVKSIRGGKPDDSIRHGSTHILAPNDAMIGVAETLRSITFEAKIDSKPARTIVLEEPITVPRNPLAS
jgi:urease gamma subunit